MQRNLSLMYAFKKSVIGFNSKIVIKLYLHFSNFEYLDFVQKQLCNESHSFAIRAVFYSSTKVRDGVRLHTMRPTMFIAFFLYFNLLQFLLYSR